MAVTEIHRFSKNPKGYFVKMKFFRTKKPEKPFIFKYFKWILWFSLSFCFFAKFLSNNEPNTTSLKAILISSQSRPRSNVISRALSESIQQKPKKGLLNDLKVYVYELPSKYNTNWLANNRCRNHLFASEVAIHRALLKSDVRTFDPSEADFFYVPVYVSCNFSTVNGFPMIGHARALLSSAVELISTELPFWKRSSGSDHVFVASHDYGACFHAMEDRAVADGIPEFMANSIILQTFGVKYNHPCQKVDSIIIPPFISPEKVKSTLSKSPIDGQRDIFAFFSWKNGSSPEKRQRTFLQRVRTEILRKYGNDRRFYLKRHRFSGYQTEIVRSIFCLCPLGWAPWSPRLVESVALGCVPVIIADGIRLPFESTVAWSDISLMVRENDVAKLGGILDYVAKTNLSEIQRNLWDPKLHRALLFNDDVENGDATWEVLVALSTKLDRSYRRSRVSSK